MSDDNKNKKQSNSLKKDDVKNASELFQFINRRSSGRIFHYTTYESLITIIKSQSFRLTRLDLLNDKAEQTLISGFETDQNYIMSFCNSEKEYVSMWAMYGKSSGIKIRLDLSSKNLERVSFDNYFFDSNLTKNIPINSGKGTPFLDRDIQLSDVVYLDKDTNSIKHNNNPFPNLVVDESLKKQLSGFLKYDAWEFEKERRLKITLNDDHQKNSPQYIFMKLPDDFFSDFSITYNPWVSKLLQEELIETLNRVTGREVTQRLSSNYGEISEL